MDKSRCWGWWGGEGLATETISHIFIFHNVEEVRGGKNSPGLLVSTCEVKLDIHIFFDFVSLPENIEQ